MKSVERVSRSAGIIPPETRTEFIECARALIWIEESDAYQEKISYMPSYWKISPWINWWTHPEIASMIFASQRTMPAERVARLPSTTNPEESMHAKIYKLVGQFFDLIPGLNALLQVEKYHHGMYDNKQSMFFPCSNFH